MHHVPDRWQTQLDQFIREKNDGQHQYLGASDFRHTVSIRFPDGSSALFRNAFYLLDRDLNEVAVFTEHCGYHYFPLFDTDLELFDSLRTDLGTN